MKIPNQNKKEGNRLFPIFLKLDKLSTLVVGGGNVGLEKVEALLKNDYYANIKLVGKSIRPDLMHLLSEHENCSFVEKSFSESDLEGVNILILATEIRETNHEIRDLAKQKNILVNVADTPDLCDFYLGSTVKKGDLKIGISTNGKSPTLAKRFRQLLEEILPEETQSLLDNLNSIRNSLKGNFTEKVKELNKITDSLVKKK